MRSPEWPPKGQFEATGPAKPLTGKEKCSFGAGVGSRFRATRTPNGRHATTFRTGNEMMSIALRVTVYGRFRVGCPVGAEPVACDGQSTEVDPEHRR